MLLRRSIMSSALDSGGGIITGTFDTLELGIGKIVNIADSASLDTVNITYGGWFNVDSTGTNATQYMLNRRTGSSGPWTSRYLSASNKLLSFQTNGGGDNYLEYVLPSPEDNWNFYLSSYDGTTNRLYVNGSVVATATGITGDLLVDSQRIRFGRQNTLGTSTQDFEGSIGPQFVFDSALSTGEKDTVYNAGLGIEPEDLPPSIKNKYTLAIPFNDGVVDPLVDRSANGNDATLVGSPSYTTPTLEFG